MNPAYQASSSIPADRANMPKKPEKKVELSEKENLAKIDSDLLSFD